MAYRDGLTNDEIAIVVNCAENVAVTLRTVNQAKGKMRMEEWMGIANNISVYNINVVLVKEGLVKADKGIKKKVMQIVSRL